MTDTAVLMSVPVALVVASPDQNREVFDPVKLRELADSVAELGLMAPIVVRRESGALSGDLSVFDDGAGTSGAGDRYVLVAGERRLRAVRDLLGWSEIPALVHDAPRTMASALQTLAENMVRDDPGPIEEARGLRDAAGEYELAPAELARMLGKSPRWVVGRLALLELADDVAHYVATGQLPISRGVAMSALDANRQRLALQAHERGISPDGFTELVARLAGEQSADSMFDTESFLRVDEYVVEAETAAVESAPAVELVRERPLGMSDVAELLEVQRGTVAQWRQRGIMPEPELVVGGSPAWWESTVRKWAAETGRG